VAANYFFNQAPRDGTVFGSFSRNFPSQALLGQTRIKADPRQFNFIGATAFLSRVCVSWHTTQVRSAKDLFEKELIVGAATGSSLSIVPTVLNHVLRTRFRIIEGYKGPADVILAIERGEVEGVCTAYAQFRNYEHHFREGKLRLLLRAEEVEVPELARVPSVYSYAKTEEQRYFLRFILSSTQFGRPYVTPPGVPADRVAILRKAMAAAVKDPALVAEAARMNLDMTYHSPAELEELVAKLYKTPASTIAEVRKLIPIIK
jgi:tripartite-type tricarboxylate transporter receptor subunit TctC